MRERNRDSKQTQKPLELSAPCPTGFEQALANELRRLGCVRVRPLIGSVSFGADVALAQRVCLWSRLASRVTLILKRVDARDADELYQGALRAAWEDLVAPGATIAVRARGGNDDLRDRRFAAMRVKDAIVDRMRERTGVRPDVDVDRPDFLVTCAIHADKATLGIDLSGESLVNRGYRVPERARAASSRGVYLREDLAQLLLDQADWPRRSSRDERALLVDPLGTSAVLAVEAASVACDRAPGLTREHWGFMGWQGFDADAWEEDLVQADEKFERGLASGRRVVVASTDAGFARELSEMSARAGLKGAIELIKGGPADIDLGPTPVPGAVLACVVPATGDFGLTSDQPVRLAAVAALARTSALAEAPIAALAARDELGFALMSKPERTVHIMNGNEPGLICVYPSTARAARLAAQRGLSAPTPAPSAHRTPGTSGTSGTSDTSDTSVTASAPVSFSSSSSGAPVPAQPASPTITLPDGSSLGVLVAASDQFAARLAKVSRQSAKWARKQGISCYRVYDADLPDYAVSIDLYHGSSATPGTWAVMSEYAAPREVDPQLAARRLADAMAIAPRVLGIDPNDVFLKVRRRERGGAQYAGSGTGAHRVGRTALVEEGSLVFEVNFTDYLDTGLFLDHRMVRQMLRERVAGGRFLNLFAYTGTASCYAADGGALSTTTVDLSATYLDWAQRNLEQNGFSSDRHELIQADVTEWVTQQRHTPNRWDLIFVDPPTFSNSARMRRKGFDVQRDHAELLIGASRILRRGGQIVFSCNLRGFTPDTDALARAGIELSDVTASTIPQDFARNARIHHCYVLTRP